MFKKILFSLAVVAGLASCKGDYTDWADPQSNAQNDPMAAVDVKAMVKSLNIVMDEQTTDSVEIMTISTGTGVTSDMEDYVIKFACAEKDTTIGLKPDAKGRVAIEDLDTIALTYYGKGNIARTLVAVAEGTASTASAEGIISVPVKSEAVNVIVTPHEIKYGEFIYYVGTTGGWNHDLTSGIHQRLTRFDSDKGIYKGYIYQKAENYGNTFRFMKEMTGTDADWSADNLYGYSYFTTVAGDVQAGSSDDNFEATQGTNVYYVEINVSEKTFKLTKITNMNLVGAFNGWNQADDAQKMTWDADNFCYVKNSAGVTADGWKFTANNGWDINLGENINALTPGGADIKIAGTTIKLYPCGTSTSGKMCATVE